jgi:hypothetical protein
MEFKKPPGKKSASKKSSGGQTSYMIADDPYDPSGIVLIGVEMGPKTSDKVKSNEELEERCTGRIRVRSDFVEEVIIKAVPKVISDDGDVLQVPAVALIYAYGYEGHSYRLAKPRIMVVVGEAVPYEPSAQDPSASLSGELSMWQMSKHDETLSIAVESGTLDKLVLEGNQPGNRAVNSYAAHMQTSHRGGKMS